MNPFTEHTGLVAPLDRANVDTDQIIPKQFLKRIERSGFGEFLFWDWRVAPDGAKIADFVLNQPEFAGATILVAGRNFGCGSSREHAPWALQDYGFRAIVAPSFADIFHSNCFQNGILPVELPEDAVADILGRATSTSGYQLTISLERQLVEDANGLAEPFEIDPFRRDCMLRGLDDIGLTLAFSEQIADHEAGRPAWMPTAR